MSPPLANNPPDDVRVDYEFGDAELEKRIALISLGKAREATAREDFKECTDAVFESGIRVAFRNRRISNCGTKRDLTVRAFRKSGAATEYEKLMDRRGSCTHFFTAWLDDRARIVDWAFISVASWRVHYAKNNSRQVKNRDGKTGFYYWPLDSIPKAIIRRQRSGIAARDKCSDCWENRDKWITQLNAATYCKVCNRFVGYLRKEETKKKKKSK